MAAPDWASQRAELQRIYAGTLADLAKEQRGLFTEYGFSGNVDDSGNSAFQVDPNLQYGRVQDLLRTHAMQRKNVAGELVGRNLGRTGLAAQRSALLKTMQGQDLTGLSNNFLRGITGILGQRGSARAGLNSGLFSLDQDQAGWMGGAGNGTTTSPAVTPPRNSTTPPGGQIQGPGYAISPGQLDEGGAQLFVNPVGAMMSGGELDPRLYRRRGGV